MGQTNENSECSSKLSMAEKKRLLLEMKLKGKSRSDPASQIEPTPKRAKESTYPMSNGERSIWAAQAISDHPESYNLISAFQIEGDFDIPRLSNAIRNTIKEHENLRSTYSLSNTTLVKQVHESAHFELETRQVQTFKEAKAEAIRISKVPFTLEEHPQVRAVLISAEKEQHLLVVSIHHIACDEWSLSLFWEAVSFYYEAGFRDGSNPIRPVPLSYSEYLHLKEEKASTDKKKNDLAYWEKELSGVAEPLALSADFAYPGTRSAKGALQELELPRSLGQKLKELCRKEKFTPFVPLLLAYYLMLRKQSEHEDIVIGTPVADRQTETSEAIVGYFLNTLPIRIRSTPEDSILKLLHSLRNKFLDGLEHQDVPIEKLVQKLSTQRGGGHHPLFQTMFVYQDQTDARESLTLPNCKVEPILIDTETSKFDLTLFTVRDGDDLKLLAEYRTDLFLPESIERFLYRYLRVLEQVVESPELTVNDVQYISREEQSKIECWEKGEPYTPPASRSILDQIFSSDRDANAIALDAVDGTLSYRELDIQSDKVARSLLSKGLSTGEVVAIMGHRSRDTVIAIVGILKAGGAYLAIDPNYPKERINKILTESNAFAIIDSSTSITDRKASPKTILQLEELLDANSDYSNEPLPLIQSNQLAYLIYTSGSSGQAKSVAVSHANLLYSTLVRREYYNLSPSPFLLLSSFSFDSSVAGLFWTLSGGGTLVLATQDQVRDPELLCALVKEKNIQASLCVPTLYRHIIDWNSTSLESLRTMILAGEACSPKLASDHLKRLPKCRLYNEYGPSEATVWASVHEITTDSYRSVPIGRPIPGLEIRVLNANGRRVGIRELGEIHIGGPGLAIGYHNQPVMTAGKFRLDSNRTRLYATGDLGCWNDGGLLEYRGRNDTQVKIRGHRIELAEIEETLSEITGAEQVVVVTRQRESDTSSEHTLEELITQLPESEVTKALDQIESGPRATDSSNNPRASRTIRRRDLTVSFDFNRDDFIAPPRKAQRDWLIGQAINEIADDLEHLDNLATTFVKGTDHSLKNETRDLTEAKLTEREFMESWQTPLMREMAAFATEGKGNVLEIGFGRGVSADFIQSGHPSSHTVIEMNPSSIEQHFKPWRKRHNEADIRLYQGRWQDVIPKLGAYDAILFHTYPMNEQEFVDYILNSITFAEHAFAEMAAHLKTGGVFTYLTTEIDSISRRHQRALFKHFSEISYKVVPVIIPEDTIDSWWAKSMVALKATK